MSISSCRTKTLSVPHLFDCLSYYSTHNFYFSQSCASINHLGCFQTNPHELFQTNAYSFWLLQTVLCLKYQLIKIYIQLKVDQSFCLQICKNSYLLYACILTPLIYPFCSFSSSCSFQNINYFGQIIQIIFMQQKCYKLFSISPNDYQIIVAFTSKQYVASQPLSLRLGTTPNQFVQAYQELLAKCCQSGFSFGLRYGDQIVSVALALDYTKYVERVEVFPYMTPISAVAELLKVQFAPHQAINIFIGCTHPQHRRQGLFLRLIQEVEKEGKKKGYTEFNGQCTNTASQRAFIQAEYQVVNRYEGRTLLKNMEGGTNMSLVIKNI